MSGVTGMVKKTKLAPVQVFLRIRPKHDGDGAPAIAYCTPKEIHMKGHLKGYTYDQIFDEKTTQLKVYKTVAGRMITDVCKGYNCTIFAYGQTGTGKTYTVTGDDCVPDVDETFNWQQESNAGIIPRAAMHLYEELNNMDPSIQRTVTVSFMEIYNEEIRDLLCDRDLIPLRIYEDKMKAVHVKNLQEVTVLNPWDIMKLLKKGCEKRQVASTLMNSNSSRSHTVFTISVSTMETVSMAENVSSITCGKLNLIDLAGSENIAKSGSKEQRAREATNINQSLLTLGRVIKALVENSSHIPYRESKLTRILQDSLGGKSKTSIVATISPGKASLDETMNTLDYAHNARNITNCPTINLKTSATTAAVQEELQRLKRDLFATANEQGIYMDQKNYDEMTQSLKQFKEEISHKHDTIRALREQVEDLETRMHEWENLKESFNKTNQAYLMMKTEIQRKEEEMLRDSQLLEYYKTQSSKLEEFADLMLSRENRLRQKLAYVSASTSQNQNVVMSIVESIKQSVDDMLCPEKSGLFSKNISTLIQFNQKICHMIDNVTTQLKEKSGHEKKTEEVADSENEDYNRTILGDVYQSIEYLRNEFQIFTETCSTTITDFDVSIERMKTYLCEFVESQQEENEKKLQVKTLLSNDLKNFDELKRNFNRIESKKNSLILEYLEERQKSNEREQRKIQELKDVLASGEFEKELAEFGEKRKRIVERISNLQNLEKEAFSKIDSISEEALQCIDFTQTNTANIKSCVLYIKNEAYKVMEHVLTDYRSQNLEMANVLEQISHILNIEGKTQIEMVKESLCAAGMELVERANQESEKVVIPMPTGDTPKTELRLNVPRIQNLIAKNLFSASCQQKKSDTQ